MSSLTYEVHGKKDKGGTEEVGKKLSEEENLV